MVHSKIVDLVSGSESINHCYFLELYIAISLSYVVISMNFLILKS